MAKDKTFGGSTGLSPQAALEVAANMEAQVPLGHPLRDTYVKLGIHPTRVDEYFAAVKRNQGNPSKGIPMTAPPKIEDYRNPPPSSVPKNDAGPA